MANATSLLPSTQTLDAIMNTTLKHLLSNLVAGAPQQFENVAVTPLFSDDLSRIAYITLSQALGGDAFTIQEVSEGGSVPDLLVVNELDTCVLLLDGEELRGAKQNRVTNATIMVDARGRLIIPVSCTEQGRWSYASRRFADSGVVLPSRHRAEKSVDVKRSLDRQQTYRSDQYAVWKRVHDLHESLAIHSPTGAMRDAYEQRRSDLERFTDALPLLDGQRGLAVAVDGKLVSIEILSRPEAYATVHAKLVQSYALEWIARRDQKQEVHGQEALTDFVQKLFDAAESRHSSVGRGLDYRYESIDTDGSLVVGSALLVDEEPVHAAFFRIDRDGNGRAADSGHWLRSRYRMGNRGDAA